MYSTEALFNRALICIGLVLLSFDANASGDAWVASIPYAISDEHVFKVKIVSIDGKTTDRAIKYRVDKGEHIVTVRLMLDVRWTPELVDTHNLTHQKDILIDFVRGTTYHIGARVDVDAPVTSQLDGSYWEPFVYNTHKP